MMYFETLNSINLSFEEVYHVLDISVKCKLLCFVQVVPIFSFNLFYQIIIASNANENN